ncbi:MAG TPA: maleylpyruvate isomerase N-terminal domain-containing protein [Actinospica sp.]|jgi:uncharacterized protein (TIGR03083 family)|nr:maleylpyruvate isomerase N-terminal domain-containing protein [Actinospica sp.]
MDEELRDDYFARLCERLGEDFRLLRAAIAAADPEAKVPSCPDWTANRLAHHVAQTYLHKVECIRNGAFPEDWPPSGLDPDPLGVLDEGFAALTVVFDEHRPSDAAATWYGPDQTVGFWIRRMCQETVVHRVDGEQVAGIELAPIPAEIALDGIDEFLDLFIGYLSVDWPEHFTDVLAHADPRPILVSGGGRAWTLEARPAGVSVRSSLAVASEEERARAGSGSADGGSAGSGSADGGSAGSGSAGAESARGALVEGEPSELLLWLWGRLGDRSVRREGDPVLLEQFLALRKKATQ